MWISKKEYDRRIWEAEQRGWDLALKALETIWLLTRKKRIPKIYEDAFREDEE